MFFDTMFDTKLMFFDTMIDTKYYTLMQCILDFLCS